MSLVRRPRHKMPANKCRKGQNAKNRSATSKLSGKRARIGRPSKLTARDKRYLVREVLKLQESTGKFHISDVMRNTGFTYSDISVRSVSRCLNEQQYRYLQTRKKGLLSESDLRQRVTFARKMIKKYPPNFWTDDVAFYLDGISVTYKTNPEQQARSPGSRIWRKRSQGLKRACTAKGKKEGTGSRSVNLIVAMSYDKGIIACEPYEKLTGDYFASFIRRNFGDMFEDAGKDSHTWIQDGDPRQNSAAAKCAMKEVNAHLLSIPPRSPDLNPIENIFNLTHRKLSKQALQKRIQQESFEDFERRVIQTLFSIPVEIVNKTIASMDKRLREIIKQRGCRIKY